MRILKQFCQLQNTVIILVVVVQLLRIIAIDDIVNVSYFPSPVSDLEVLNSQFLLTQMSSVERPQSVGN